MVEVYLIGFLNTTQLAEVGLGDLLQSFCVLWIFCNSLRNCCGPAMQRVWSEGRTGISMHRSRGWPRCWGAKSIQQLQFLAFHTMCWLRLVSMCVLFAMQGEEGPPSLEYIQAKDLFPPKELVKEEESLQVRK